MQATAAVMRALHAPLTIETIELDPPGPGEVLIKMAAAGICGSDKHVIEGHFPAPLPSICGHEGAGVVTAVGSGVDTIAVGDHVIHTFVGPCGSCQACRRGKRTFCTTRPNADGTLLDGSYRMHGSAGEPIGTTLGLGSFSSYTVSPARNCVVVPEDLDLSIAALISCGVATGVGSVLNVARVQPGDNVCVVGVGGVGAAAIMGAVVGGAAQVVAIDLNASKAAAALAFGATAFVPAASTGDAGADAATMTSMIRDLTGGWGVERMILTVDRTRPEHYRMAMESLAPGGIAVQVGSSAGIDHIPVPPSTFTRTQGSFTGTVYGGMDPGRDALRYVELYRSGRLPLDKLISRTYPLERINEAFDDLAAGRNIRGVVQFST